MGARVKPDRARLMSRVAERRSNPDPSRKASLNTIAAAPDYGARTVVELILNPMLAAGLGTYLYGARRAWRLTGYIWASSGRSSQALQRAIANKQHTADHEEKRRHVGSAIVVWFIFLPLLGSIGAICVWAAPYALKTPARYVGDVRITAALLVADAVALTLLTVPRSVLQGENLGYKRMGLSALLVVGQGALTALALILDNRDRRRGGGEHRGHAHHRRHVPAGRPPSCSMVLASPVLRERRSGRFLGLSWWFTGWKVLMQLMAGGDLLVLGFFGSVELVTVYALSKFVPEALTALLATIVQAVSPGWEA